MKNILQILFRTIESFFFLFKRKTYVIYIAKNKLMFNNIITILKSFEDDKRICNYVCFPSPHLMTKSEANNLAKQDYRV